MKYTTTFTLLLLLFTNTEASFSRQDAINSVHGAFSISKVVYGHDVVASFCSNSIKKDANKKIFNNVLKRWKSDHALVVAKSMALLKANSDYMADKNSLNKAELYFAAAGGYMDTAFEKSGYSCLSWAKKIINGDLDLNQGVFKKSYNDVMRGQL